MTSAQMPHTSSNSAAQAVLSTPQTVCTIWEAGSNTTADVDKNLSEVSVENFLQSCMPHCPGDDIVDACVTQLRAQGHINEQGVWETFGVRHEQETYPLGLLSQHILSVHPDKLSSPTCKIEEGPHDKTDSETEGSSFIGMLLHSTVLPGPRVEKQDQCCSNIVFAAEFKLNLADLVQLSIDGDVAHLWYFSRSHSVRSTAFSARKDVHTLIKFVLAILFGTPEQLGFDASITHKQDMQGNLYYVYKVNEHYYRTIGKPISEHYARGISGRATRVWKVEPCDKDGTVLEGCSPCVLKDCWLEGDYTELQLQKAIFERLEKQKGSAHILKESPVPAPRGPSAPVLESAPAPALGEASTPNLSVPAPNQVEVLSQSPPLCALKHILPDDREERACILAALDNYREYFIAIIEEEVLPQFIPCVPSSRTACRFDDDTPVRSASPSEVLSTTRTGYEDQLTISHDSDICLTRAFTPRRYCRIIYEEVCETVDNLSSIKEIARTLHDCVIAIHLLYLVGYIHRDISVGNVFYSTTANRGKLSDLEYARPFHCCDAATDSKIGTPAFMANDLLAGVYTTWNGREKPDAVLHNLHDLESVLWLTLWVFSQKTTELPQDPEKHQSLIKSLFDINARIVRSSLMGNSNTRQTIVSSLLSYTFQDSSSFEVIYKMFDDYTMQVWEIQAVKDDKHEDLDDRKYCNCFGAARRCFHTILKDCRGFVDSY
ncbi:hypothetical protein VKT23_008652 [Stygiomarasmius scandens]|uniref:Fungal-type protein kinase domain-containing protein n=1 Tax=Marasmiellus scandens TaxID=2682957 RepID=A0ABR1JJB8_9AGAR